MTLPSSGSSISMSQINSEFGGGYSLGSYYKGGSYVTANDYAPNDSSSGAISMGGLLAAKKNSFNSASFTNSTTWTAPAQVVGNVSVYVGGGGGGGGSRGR